MAEVVDCRGLPCPEPVVRAKRAVEASSDVVQVLVDDVVARENLVKLGRGMNWRVDVTEADGYFRVTFEKDGVSLPKGTVPTEPGLCTLPLPTTVFINADSIGRGSDELGRALMKAFLYSLTQIDACPERIIFMNSGVRLVVEGSPVLEVLSELKAKGVEIWACGTCLEYFDIKDRVAVGEISNMYSIVQAFMDSTRVITI
ncbi:MAG: sulfurtransferase-like selenium metabolism protein YedF [Bacillota bacterium]